MTAARKLKRLKCSSQASERDYDRQKYWNDRYAAQLKGKNVDDDDHTDEWYFSYSDISDVLKSYLKKSHRNSPILDIGCGLSKIFDELSNDHFTGPFIGIDYSSVVINQCKKIKKNNNYHYLTIDMMQKQKPDLSINSFGLIIDKGTTDGILCNKFHLSTISNMYEHASNFLSSNGLFVIITIKTVDDKEWFEDCLIPALIQGCQNHQTKFIIHFHRCMTYTDGTETGPNIFVIVKYDCKSYSLRSSTNRDKQDLSQIVTVKCY
jgi:2-polyprenyl-3-methyl-5-hydroxy-6-metoxy-1,4-benzoquinol methylase